MLSCDADAGPMVTEIALNLKAHHGVNCRDRRLNKRIKPL